MLKSKRNIKLALRQITGPIRRLPDFLVIGAQKGGTRFLYHCLDQHPDITMANALEVHYFDIHFNKGINWYRSFFPLSTFSKAKVIGEVTPRYLLSDQAPSRCKAALPEAKIIVLLRNPIERAYSHYNMTKRTKGISLSFEEYIDKTLSEGQIEIEKDGLKKMKELNALKRGLYSVQIKKWLTCYPRQNCLFLESESFFRDPNCTVRQIHEFIGVPHRKLKDLTPQNTGNYQEEIKPATRLRLAQYFEESNDWLRKQGFDFEWLK